MIKVENIEAFNFEGAFRGLRNPMNSWAKGDSGFVYDREDGTKSNTFIIGPNDLKLAQRMIGGGAEEAKFLRQIFVSMDIIAPMYWWKEFDTYKVATTANSCSTMHKLTSEPISRDMFSFDEIDGDTRSLEIMRDQIVNYCEALRQEYNLTKDKRIWRELVAILPMAFNQRRTWSGNYQVLRNMYFQRRNHKLQEWKDFCEVIENLPYAKDLICYEKE